MNQENQQHKDDIVATIQKALAIPPSEGDVASSFRKTMVHVTKQTEERILVRPQNEASIISPFLMQLHTKLSLAAGTLVVVLLVGYMTYSRSNPYLDIETAAVEEQSEYDLVIPEDDFSDLNEDQIDSLEVTSGEAAPTAASNPAPSSVPAPSTNTTLDVSSELASFDSLFSSDDIDDSSLESWVSDTSASDVLTESYDI